MSGLPAVDGANGPGPVAGIDIGGTKTAVIIVDAVGAVLGRATRSSSVGDQDGAAAAILATLDDALRGASMDRDDLRAVGVGVPGRVDARLGTVTMAVNLGWHDYPLRDELERRLRRPVVVENDTRAAAIGLVRRGVLGDVDGIAYLAVGTGIAAGVVLGGEVYRGARGLAGEIGHVITDHDGPPCTCGQRGCLEAFASGPSIARRARLDRAEDVFAAAVAGAGDARELIDDVGRRLAWAVHLLVMTYDVERVVIGGGVSHAGPAFADPIRTELARLRAASPMAGELLPADIVEFLPSGADAGAWGAVTIAERAGRPATGDPDHLRAPGEEVVRHV